MSKEKVFRELYKNHTFRDAYLDELPDEFQNLIMDNAYSQSMWKDHYAMLDVVFGEHKDAIEWFLYEWQPGYEVGANGKIEKIMDIDQYIQWMKDNEDFV